MKNIVKWTLGIIVGVFFIACGGSNEVKGFSKSGNVGSLKITYSSDKPLTLSLNRQNHKD